MCTFVCMDIMWCSQTVLTVFTVWEGAFICLFVASWHQSLSALLLYLCCDELRSSDRWNLLFRVQVAGTVSGLTGVLNKFVTVRTFYQSDKPAGRSLRISPNVCVCARACAFVDPASHLLIFPRHFAGHSCCMPRRLTDRSVAKCNGRVLAPNRTVLSVCEWWNGVHGTDRLQDCVPGEGWQWQLGYCSPSAGIVVVCVYTVDKDGRSLIFHVQLVPKHIIYVWVARQGLLLLLLLLLLLRNPEMLSTSYAANVTLSVTWTKLDSLKSMYLLPWMTL